MPVPGPFPLNDPDRVRPLLRSAGFEDVQLRGLSEPMYFGPVCQARWLASYFERYKSRNSAISAP
jgi:hypothetical protein